MIMVKRIFSLILFLTIILAFIPVTKAFPPSWSYEIDNITTFSMSSNGNYVAVGTTNGDVYFLNRYGELLTYVFHPGEIRSIDISDDGHFSICGETGIFFHDKQGRVIWTYRAESLDVDISSDGGYIVVGSSTKLLLFNRQGLMYEIFFGEPIHDVSISRFGEYLIAAKKDTLYFFHPHSKGSEVISQYETESHIISAAISDNGECVAVKTEAGRLYLFDNNGEELWKYNPDIFVVSVAISDYIAVVSEELDMLDFKGNVMWSSALKRAPKEIRISGKYIAVMSDLLSLVDLDGNMIWNYSIENLRSIELSEEGKELAAISDDKVFYFNLDDHELLYTFFYPYPSRKANNLDSFEITAEAVEPGLRRALVGDINGDGENEIVGIVDEKNENLGTMDEILVAWNSKGETLWKRLVKRSVNLKYYLFLLDVNRDLAPEIIISYYEDEKLYMKFFNGDNIFIKEISINLGVDMFRGRKKEYDAAAIHPTSAFDIDGDNKIELVCILSSSYALKPRGILLLEYSSEELEWYYPVAPGISQTAISDINNDGVLEIILGTHAPCNGNREGETDDCHSYVIAIDENRNELWVRQLGEGFKRAQINVDDINNDGLKEIVVSSFAAEENWGTLTVLDINGDVIAEEDYGYSVLWSSISDFNDDGYKEIVTGNSDNIIRLYDHDLRKLKEEELRGIIGQRNAIINDINGDGAKEIFVPTDDGYLIILNQGFSELWRREFESLRSILVTNMGHCANDLIVVADSVYLYSFTREHQLCVPQINLPQMKLQKNLEFYEDIAEANFSDRNYLISKDYYVMAIDVAEQLNEIYKKNEFLERLKTIDFYLEAEIYFEKSVDYLEAENCKEADINLRIAKLKFTSLYDMRRIEQIDKLLSDCEKCFKAEKHADNAGYLLLQRKYGDAIDSFEKSLLLYRELNFQERISYIENEIEHCRMMIITKWSFFFVFWIVLLFMILLKLFPKSAIGGIAGKISLEVESFLYSLMFVSFLLFWYPDTGVVAFSSILFAATAFLHLILKKITVSKSKEESRKEISKKLKEIRDFYQKKEKEY